MRLLLIDRHAQAALDLRDRMQQALGSAVQIEHVSAIGDGVQRLSTNQFDAVLLDIDSFDLIHEAGLHRVIEADPRVPVLTLGQVEDSELALKLVKRGAQDYVVKGQADGMPLLRAIRYAIERKRIERHLQFLADYDPLTGLANRKHFSEELRKACARADRSGLGAALLLIDLDGFKAVNDNFGHEAGDAVLRRIAGRLKASVRQGDLVARLGGDEFVVLLNEVAHAPRAERVAWKLLKKLDEPVRVGDRLHDIGGSIGIALYPDDGNVGTLLKNADLAMYQAKQSGGNDLRFYSELSPATSSPVVGNTLSMALETGALKLSLRPRLELHSGRVVGYEGEAACPSIGIDAEQGHRLRTLAQASGLDVRFGQALFAQSLELLKSLSRQDDPGGGQRTLAVTLPGRYVFSDSFARELETSLADQQYPASRLCIQIPAEWAFDDLERRTPRLNSIAASGVNLWLDGFGEAPCPLATLESLPVHGVKLAPRLLQRAEQDHGGRHRRTLEAVIAFARALGISVLASGIDDGRQLDAMRRAGCDYVQGRRVGALATIEGLTPDGTEAAAADGTANQPGDTPTCRALDPQRG
ncbi:MAG: diguanylate cyclase [Gammaproteobacteria bacterium]|nr:diguanylate cyclase [Gammaproteobacteria bacterium]